MSKRSTPTCADCYFRRAGLCALPGETICPTFRVQSVGTLAPPPRPRLVPRAISVHAAAYFVGFGCAPLAPPSDRHRRGQRPLAAAALSAPDPAGAARCLRDRLHPREPEAGERPLRARDGQRVARLADPARARRRPARRDPARAARAPPAPPLEPGARALRRPRRSRRARRS